MTTRPFSSCTSIVVASLVLVVASGAATAPDHSAVTPAERTGGHKERFLELNRRVQARPDAKLIFIGDSITQGWEGAGADVWGERFAPLVALNLGISGDRTQHVLWRLRHGNVDGISPTAAVIMIGTNNSNGQDNTVPEIAGGVTAIVQSLRDRLPETRILLLGIFPRGEQPNPQRGKILQVNQIIRKLDDGEHVHYLDIGHRFVDSEGTIPKDIMPDFLHLSPHGYDLWADAIAPKLAELMES